MALGSTQPLTERSTRNFPGGKSGRRIGLTTLPPSVSRMSQNVGASTSRNPKGLHGLYRDNFTFTFNIFVSKARIQAYEGKWYIIREQHNNVNLHHACWGILLVWIAKRTGWRNMHRSLYLVLHSNPAWWWNYTSSNHDACYEANWRELIMG
jgi:hypothetical protein